MVTNQTVEYYTRKEVDDLLTQAINSDVVIESGGEAPAIMNFYYALKNRDGLIPEGFFCIERNDWENQALVFIFFLKTIYFGTTEWFSFELLYAYLPEKIKLQYQQEHRDYVSKMKSAAEENKELFYSLLLSYFSNQNAVSDFKLD